MTWHTTSRQSRGYGAAWERARKETLEQDEWLCRPCRKAGRVTLALEVDHIVSKAIAKRQGWSNAQIEAPNNRQSICRECHLAKSALERGYEYRPKVTIGADGFPIEDSRTTSLR